MEHKITIDININIKDGLDKLKIDDDSLDALNGLIKNVFSTVTKPVKPASTKKKVEKK